MNIIKTFIPSVICLCAVNLLQAQSIKTEIAPAVQVKSPAIANTQSPSPQPVMKPQPGTALPAATAMPAASQKPLTLKEDEPKKPPVGANAIALTYEAAQDDKNLTAEQLKIFNGARERPASATGNSTGADPALPQNPAAAKEQH